MARVGGWSVAREGCALLDFSHQPLVESLTLDFTDRHDCIFHDEGEFEDLLHQELHLIKKPNLSFNAFKKK